ncbi:MAG: T9SS type A sorting domain-containing protein [Weeksellaceae bacterium]
MRNLITKLLLLGFMPLAVYGQTIVSTTPENKKAILEEFTGIYCTFCPDGHAIAQQILSQNPGNAFVINIHEGGFAVPGSGAPDFRTPFGTAIAGQSGLTGYPAATVNRHVFPGKGMSNGSTAMGRSWWKTTANEIMAMPSYLNMAVEASIDIDTRVMTVHVEGYYTGNSPQSTNLLNVALLQNNTKGPQTGGGQGNNYNHMHRLVHLITGQWGEEISTTTQGSFVDKTYTYTIPADYNGVPTVLPDMEIVVFMTETHQEIISGNGAFPSLIGLEYQNDAAIVNISDLPVTCGNRITPEITIQNNGEQTLTNLAIEFSTNGQDVQTYNWTGSLTSLRKEKITLPESHFNKLLVNELVVTILNQDEDNSNNSMTKEFDDAATATSTSLKLTINTDGKGAQTRWIIKNSSNQTIIQGNGYANNQTYEIDIEIPDGNDCYSFRILDTGSDGGATILLKDVNGTVLNESDGNYGAGYTIEFKHGQLGLSEQDLTAVNIYPNPSNGVVNVTSDKTIDSVQVYDLSGKLIRTLNKLSTNKTELDLSAFGKGTYVLRIETGKTVTTKKVIIK